MLTVRLHGHLEEKYGSEFKFEAFTVREVIDALQANFDDFTEEFIKDQRAYNILVDAEAQEMIGCILPIKSDSTIDIIPVIGGAGFLKTIGLIIVAYLLIVYAPYLAGYVTGGGLAGGAGAVGAGFAASSAALGVGLTGATGALATGIAALGWGLALAGVASLLAGPDGPDGGGPESSSLSQTENIVGQGMPIPVGYGRLMVGSVVLSATFSSSYTETASRAWTYENILTGNTEDVQMNYGPQNTLTTSMAGTDGFTIPVSVYDGGYGLAQWANLIAVNEAALGGGTYQVVNHTTSVGTTIATPVYKPVRIAGVYTGDSLIDHR